MRQTTIGSTETELYGYEQKNWTQWPNLEK